MRRPVTTKPYKNRTASEPMPKKSFADLNMCYTAIKIQHRAEYLTIRSKLKRNEIQQLSPGGPDQRQSIRNQPRHLITSEPGHEKMCLMSYANNKGADQPAHPRSLISDFVVRFLDSIISLDSIAKISRLASFCGCAGQFVSGLVGNSRRHVLS